MKALALLLLATVGLLAQDTSSSPVIPAPEIKTIGPVRFQICVATNSTGIPTIIKIDTLTGESWVYQFTGDELRSKGIPSVWTYIPNNGPAIGK